MPQINPFSSIAVLAKGLRSGAFTSLEITEFFLGRIEKYNDLLGAFTEVYEKEALAAAKAQDLLLSAGIDLGPLHGIPVAIKDLLHINGKVCTAGSKLCSDSISSYTADAVMQLQKAGMVIIGKTQMVEFAFGGWGTNHEWGAPKNPWDLNLHRIPGGSSSGSGVAVAAGLVPAALGTDTGGSVRIPAAFNGIVGFKPSHSKVSTKGCIPLSETLDSIGPMTRTVQDSLWIYDAMRGESYRQLELIKPPQLFHISSDAMPSTAKTELVDNFEAFLGRLIDYGLDLTPTNLPFELEDYASLSGDIITAEAYAYHKNTLESDPSAYGPVTYKKLMFGSEISSAQYLSRMKERDVNIENFREFLSDKSFIITPTIGYTAIPVSEVDESKASMSSFTRPVNYLNGTAIAIPAGLDSAGLPWSLQVIGCAGDEINVLKIGAFLESFLAFDKVPASL